MLLLLLLLAGCGQSRWPDEEQVSREERIVIRFNHAAAENTPKGLAARRFADLVKERTAGRVEVQVFANAGLYTDTEELEALRQGQIQMAAPSLSELAALNQAWSVFDLPYLFSDSQQVERVIASRVGQELYADLGRQGLEPLALWYDGLRQISNARHSILLPDDLRSLRFRVEPSQTLRELFTAAGARPAIHAYSDLYGLLDQGEVDGQASTPANMYAKRFHEVQPYLTLSSHGYQGYVVLVSRPFWNQLSPGLRETLREAMADTTQWLRENAGRLNAEALVKIRASGKVLIHEQTPNERELWRHAMRPVYEEAEQRLGSEFLQAVLREAKAH